MEAIVIARQKEWHPGEMGARKRCRGRCEDVLPMVQEYLYSLWLGRIEEAEAKERRVEGRIQ